MISLTSSGSALYRHTHDQRVDADGFSGTGRTGNQKMRHLCDIRNDCLSSDIFSDGKCIVLDLGCSGIPCDSRRSRSITALFSLFGTSIPTAAFPGIGASIRISAAARFSLISSASRNDLADLDTHVPAVIHIW